MHGHTRFGNVQCSSSHFPFKNEFDFLSIFYDQSNLLTFAYNFIENSKGNTTGQGAFIDNGKTQKPRTTGKVHILHPGT